jgi:hypothetical protein
MTVLTLRLLLRTFVRCLTPSGRSLRTCRKKLLPVDGLTGFGRQNFTRLFRSRSAARFFSLSSNLLLPTCISTTCASPIFLKV